MVCNSYSDYTVSQRKFSSCLWISNCLQWLRSSKILNERDGKKYLSRRCFNAEVKINQLWWQIGPSLSDTLDSSCSFSSPPRTRQLMSWRVLILSTVRYSLKMWMMVNMPAGLIGWQPVGSLKATRQTQHECHRRVGSTAVPYLKSPGLKSGPAHLCEDSV